MGWVTERVFLVVVRISWVLVDWVVRHVVEVLGFGSFVTLEVEV